GADLVAQEQVGGEVGAAALGEGSRSVEANEFAVGQQGAAGKQAGVNAGSGIGVAEDQAVGVEWIVVDADDAVALHVGANAVVSDIGAVGRREVHSGAKDAEDAGAGAFVADVQAAADGGGAAEQRKLAEPPAADVGIAADGERAVGHRVVADAED